MLPEAASLLMGKNAPIFARNAQPETRVNIINASKANIPHKKLEGKLYFRFTGYPGGRKSETLGDMIKKEADIQRFSLRLYGDASSNKLRSIMIRNLNITE